MSQRTSRHAHEPPHAPHGGPPGRALAHALTHALFLALASLRHATLRSALLAVVLGVSLGMPVAIAALLDEAADDMRARTRLAPLVLGARGSEADLVFGALYFATTPPRGLAMGDLARVEAERLARAIPIAVGPTARKAPVVGTAIDYFDLRGLAPAQGTLFATIGEAVAGARAARELGLAPGSRLFTDPAGLSNLAGVFPLELVVTGVLPETNSPDDAALFVDLPTFWTIEGLGHRHADPRDEPQALMGTRPATAAPRGGASASAAPSEGASAKGTDRAAGRTADQTPSQPAAEVAIASEALRIDRSATGAIDASFHFHGDTAEFEIGAALVVPRDAKAQAILLGRFAGARDEPLQLVRPDQFAERVLDRIFGVGRILAAVALATAALVALVAATAFSLSIRLRADELALMRRLGASRARVAGFLAVEATLLLAIATAIAALLALAAPAIAPAVLRVASGG
jgi:putative ABC transport system permease protein